MIDRPKMVPVVFGEVLFDCFPDGTREMGGAPFNVAWHLQAFGLAPVFVSRVGDDEAGVQVQGTMQGWGMRTDFLQNDKQHTTGEVRVTLDAGQPSYEIVLDSAWDFIDGNALLNINPDPALIYHGTLALRHEDSCKALYRLVSENPGVPVFMDVNLRAPWWSSEMLPSLFTHTRWLKINDEELAELVDTGDSLEQKADWLIQKYEIALVIVTCGGNGAFAIETGNTPVYVKPEEELHVVSTVGAGDAFASVCIAGLLRDWPLQLTLERAQSFASLLVQQQGATISTMAAYRTLMKDW